MTHMKDKDKEFKITQRNLHHAKLATDILNIEFTQEDLSLALIQEPLAHEFKIRDLSAGNLVFDSKVKKPRSLIMIRKNIPYIPLTQFINKDLVSILVTLNGSQKVVFASAYLPGDTLEVPQDLRNLMQYCIQNQLEIIIGCDANAHHLIWGSTNTNERGENVLDFIIENNLEIINKGSRPTFVVNN